MCGCIFWFILSLFSPRNAGSLSLICIIKGMGKNMGNNDLSIERGNIDLVLMKSRSIGNSQTV